MNATSGKLEKWTVRHHTGSKEIYLLLGCIGHPERTDDPPRDMQAALTLTPDEAATLGHALQSTGLSFGGKSTIDLPHATT